MKSLLLILHLALFVLSPCYASVKPFKSSKITVDYGMGRKAIFTCDEALLTEREKFLDNSDHRIPKIVGVEFVFANGKKAQVNQEGLKGIQMTDLLKCKIEALRGDGSWALTVRIQNKKGVADRIADDWVVFIFKNYAYTSRWFELNEKFNAEKKKDADVAGQPEER